jgi:hypothetical protein
MMLLMKRSSFEKVQFWNSGTMNAKLRGTLELGLNGIF